MLYLLVAIAQNCKKINQKIIKKTVSCNGHGCRMSFLYNFLIQFFYNFKAVRPTNTLLQDYFELRSSSFTFGRTQASSVLLSLNHDLASVHNVNTWGRRYAIEFTSAEVVNLVYG